MFYAGLVQGVNARKLRAICDLMHADIERAAKAGDNGVAAPKLGKKVVDAIRAFDPNFKS